MHSRTRRLLTGAALMLLAIVCAAAFSAATAAAASQHTAAKIHKISACGYTATASGTYELTKNVTDSGSGTCITLNGNNITLYLDMHTITGTGTDTCLLVEGGGTAENVNETVIGGTKAKPKRSASLNNCSTGLVVERTSGTKASYLKISSPTDTGVVESLAGGMMLSNINVQMHAITTANGVVLSAGADNVVTKSLVNTNGSTAGFVAASETGDSFTYNGVTDTYSGAGSTGVGFVDAQSSRNTWSHNSSNGQANGFVFAENGYGPVTATYNSATGHANAGTIGFNVINAFKVTDPSSQRHTLISHNKTTGFQQGFYDHSDSGYPSAETWTNNTANNYSEYGFFIDYATDYTMTGNIADANTAMHKYTGGSTCGFCLAHTSPVFAFASFSKNQAYDSYFGFDAEGTFVGGKGNVAKRNKYNALNVEITG